MANWKLWITLVALCIVPLVGCNQRPATAQISGKVLYKNGSAPKGGVRMVRFEPTDDSPASVRKGASGEIREDGTFEMYTRKPGDGVFLGKYAVTFAVWKGPRDPQSLVDEKYTNSATTPYIVEIDGDRDDFAFEIEPIGASSD